MSTARNETPAVIEHFEKPHQVKIIQLVKDEFRSIIGLGDDGELYERFSGKWCYLDAPKDTSGHEPSRYLKLA